MGITFLKFLKWGINIRTKRALPYRECGCRKRLHGVHGLFWTKGLLDYFEQEQESYLKETKELLFDYDRLDARTEDILREIEEYKNMQPSSDDHQPG